jgi:hypothetical protein
MVRAGAGAGAAQKWTGSAKLGKYFSCLSLKFTLTITAPTCSLRTGTGITSHFVAFLVKQVPVPIPVLFCNLYRGESDENLVNMDWVKGAFKVLLV